MTLSESASLTPEQLRVAVAERLVVYKSDRHEIIINAEDAHLLDGWKVYPKADHGLFYGQLCRWNPATKRQQKKLLHRVIMNPKPYEVVCHLDGNGLNCLRSNLAVGSHRDNANSYHAKRSGSSSKYRGVYINNGGGKKWTASFWEMENHIYLGRYDSQEEAARAYDAEALKRFGKFAHLNFPMEPNGAALSSRSM